MGKGIDMDSVVEYDKYLKSFGGDVEELESLHKELLDYLSEFDWTAEVKEVYVGLFYEGILGVFLVKILPARKDIDEMIWVIVGDLPPAYITTEDSPNPACALDAYIGAMSEWVAAVRQCKSVVGLIPVNVSPSKENAERLETRLNFIDKNILSEYQEDLKR